MTVARPAVVSVREFRRRLAAFVRHVRTEQRPVFITRHGQLAAALIPARGADRDRVEALVRERRETPSPCEDYEGPDLYLAPVRFFRRHLAAYIRYVRARQAPVFISRGGRVVAALVPVSDAWASGPRRSPQDFGGSPREAVEAFCRRRRVRPLTKEEVIARLRAVLPELRARYGVRRLVLFGSFARGTPDPDSDVDVVVVSDRPLGLEFFGLQGRLEEALGRPVDAATPGALGPVRRAVDREGIVIDADGGVSGTKRSPARRRR